MNWITRQIDEFTCWLVNQHNQRMRLQRENQERLDRSQRHHEMRRAHKARVAQRGRIGAMDEQQRQVNRDALEGLRDVREHMASQHRRH